MKKIIRLTESDLTRIVKRVIRENEDMMKSPMENNKIHIPREFKAVRNLFGSISASPEDIIDMYNEVIGYDGIPLVNYSGDMFTNEDDDEIAVDDILDELNYGLTGKEYDDDEEEDF